LRWAAGDGESTEAAMRGLTASFLGGKTNGGGDGHLKDRAPILG